MNKQHRLLKVNFTGEITKNLEDVKKLLISNFHDIIDVNIEYEPKESKVKRFLVTSDSCTSDQILYFLRGVNDMSVTSTNLKEDKKTSVKSSLLTVATFMEDLENKLSNSEGGLSALLGDIDKLKLAVFGAKKQAELDEKEKNNLSQKNEGLQSKVLSLETRIKNIENHLAAFNTVHDKESK